MTAKQVVAALIVNDQEKVLICQRRPDQALPLKWEFPGGKIEEGETPEQALCRELEEELAIRAVIGPEMARLEHIYKNGNGVALRFFLVSEYEGTIANRIFEDVRWVRPQDMPKYDFLDADVGLVSDLASGAVRFPNRSVNPTPRLAERA